MTDGEGNMKRIVEMRDGVIRRDVPVLDRHDAAADLAERDQLAMAG